MHLLLYGLRGAPARVMYQNPTLTLLHRSPGRREYLRANKKPIVFDTGLNCWVVLDPDLAAAALTDPRLAQIDYHEANEELARIARLSLSNIHFTLAHNPISRDGDLHVTQRKATARHLANHRRNMGAALTAAVDRCAFRFDTAGELEVMSEIIIPAVNLMIGALIGVPVSGDEPAATMSRLFDRLGSARRHVEADRQIGEARDRIKAAHDDISEAEVGAALSLWVLGYDAMIGTLGESLRLIFETQSGSALSAMSFPDNPPETGVAYIARTARTNLEFGGVAIKAGQRLRVTLQSSAYSDDPKQQARMFGAGIHTCVGRPAALDLWRALTAKLATIDRKVEFLGSKLRDQDYLFVYPDYLKVHVT